MANEIAEYEIGKRHLANIMGEDPDSFRQEDIDVRMKQMTSHIISNRAGVDLFSHTYDALIFIFTNPRDHLSNVIKRFCS